MLARFGRFFDELDELRRLYGDHLDTAAVQRKRAGNGD
jgi:hypothetical protein